MKVRAHAACSPESEACNDGNLRLPFDKEGLLRVECICEPQRPLTLVSLDLQLLPEWPGNGPAQCPISSKQSSVDASSAVMQYLDAVIHKHAVMLCVL